MTLVADTNASTLDEIYFEFIQLQPGAYWLIKVFEEGECEIVCSYTNELDQAQELAKKWKTLK